MKGQARHGTTGTRRHEGQRIGDWTLVRMLEDSHTSYCRIWLAECACGYKARRAESELTMARLTKCSACAIQEKKRQRAQGVKP